MVCTPYLSNIYSSIYPWEHCRFCRLAFCFAQILIFLGLRKRTWSHAFSSCFVFGPTEVVWCWGYTSPPEFLSSFLKKFRLSEPTPCSYTACQNSSKIALGELKETLSIQRSEWPTQGSCFRCFAAICTFKGGTGSSWWYTPRPFALSAQLNVSEESLGIDRSWPTDWQSSWPFS